MSTSYQKFFLVSSSLALCLGPGGEGRRASHLPAESARVDLKLPTAMEKVGADLEPPTAWRSSSVDENERRPDKKGRKIIIERKN
jgi:hypothetical protein